MICDKCGADVPDGWPRCTDCGAPTASGSTGSPVQGAEDDVFPLLAAANLSRLRGQFDEAERQSVEILRRYPNSPAAHSLLGEIFEDRGRYDDAITWYQLALELDPTNEKDRGLLARVMQKQAGAQQPQDEAHAPLPPPAPGWMWFAQPPYSLWALGAALLLIGVLSFLAVSHRMPRTHDSGVVGMTTPPREAPNQRTAADANPVAPPSATVSASEAETPDEVALQQRLAAFPRAEQPAFTIESVETDPRMPGSYARVTGRISQPIDPQTARIAIAQAAATIAEAAAQQQLQTVTVRIIGAAPQSSLQLLFVADASPPAFANIDIPTASQTPANLPFQNPWWAPGMS